MNQLGKPIQVLLAIAIASTGMNIPTLAATDTTTSEESRQLAQTSLVGQCRAVKQQIPIFGSADATSEALRLLATNEEVTLADASVDINGFIGISAPTSGYVHAVNLKACSGGSNPDNASLCRQVARPPQGLLIRREPSTTARVVGSLAYLGRVTLTTNPPTARRVGDRNWVEISSPARGWVSNGLVSEPESNLVYCP